MVAVIRSLTRLHLLAFFVLLFSSVCAYAAAHDTFTAISPSPSVNTIHDSWSPDGNNWYLAGDGGTILQFDGSTFTAMDTPTDCALFAIHGTSASNIWAVGGCQYGYDQDDARTSVILHYDGTGWSSQTPPDFLGYYYTMTDVWAANTTTAYATAASSTYMAKYASGSWSFQDTGLTLYMGLNAVYGFGTADVYAAGDCGQIIHYDGSSWSLQRQEGECDGFSTDLLYDVWGPGSSALFAAGNYEPPLRQSGASWLDLPDPTGTNASQTSIAGTSATNIYFAGYTGKITHWNGTDYTNVLNPGNGPLLTSMNRRSDGNYLLTGENGSVSSFNGSARTDLNTPAQTSETLAYAGRGAKIWACPADLDSGQGPFTFDGTNLTQHNIGITEQIAVTDMSFLSDNEVWVGGWSRNTLQPVVRKFDGYSWSTQNLGGGYLIDALRDGSGRLFTIRGSTWGSDLGGYTGQPCLTADTDTCYTGTGSSTLKDLAVGDDGTVYAVGGSGLVVAYSGGTWSAQSSGTAKDLLGVAAGGGWVCAVGRDRTAICKQDGGSWSAVTGISAKTENAFVAIAANASGEFYALLNTGNDADWSYTGADKGTIYRIANGAGSVVAGELTPQLHDVAVSSDNEFVMVGSSGTLYGDPMDAAPATATLMPMLETLLLD